MTMHHTFGELVRETLNHHPILYNTISNMTPARALQVLNEHCGTSYTGAEDLSVVVHGLLEALRARRA